MTRSELPVPEHFDPATVGEIWRVDYQEIASTASQWRLDFDLAPAERDQQRICLLLVDVQNTFCIPGFELFVAGRSGTAAVEDNRRLSSFLYRNLHRVTQVLPTMDTHQAFQIFHPAFLEDSSGRHPRPYSLITLENLEVGRWKVSRSVSEALGLEVEYLNRHIFHYARSLKSRQKYEWTIWPYHSMLGGIGHALVSAVEEAVFFHSIARFSQPDFQIKGRTPLTEHYSVFGPEVLEGPDQDPIGQKNRALIEVLKRFDVVIIAGQAKSHCVAWTIEDLLEAPEIRQGDLARRFYLLEDCTSPVVVPGVVDYTEPADEAFERFRAAGMHTVRSTDPFDSWPDIA